MIMSTHKNALPRQLLTAAILAVGFGTVWCVLVAWLGTSIISAWPGKPSPRYESLVVAADGTPLIQSFSTELSRVTHRDLNGDDYPTVDDTNELRAVYLNGEHGNLAQFPFDQGWEKRIKVFTDEKDLDAVWYFVHDGRADGSGYFVGYNRISNEPIGYIGLSGFRRQPIASEEQIPVRAEQALSYNTSWSSAQLSINWGRGYQGHHGDKPPRLVHVPSGNSLRVVDLASRKIETVFESPEPIMSVGVPSSVANSIRNDAKERPILVRAGTKIYKLDQDYKVVGTFNVPAEIDRDTPVTWYESHSGKSIAEYSLAEKGGKPVSNVRRQAVYTIASDGTIRNTTEIALQNGAVLEKDEEQFLLFTLALPSPAALLACVPLTALEDRSPREATPSGAFLKRLLPSLAASLAISLILATVAWRRTRVFGLSLRDQIAWMIFVLLLGVPAFVGFLLHRRWPVREVCPVCHVRCARDREGCSKCGTPFAAPALKGTEIFA